MINGKKFLAVIPARSGSKGIPNKNMVNVCNKPLIEYTLEFVKCLNWIDFIHVSSDSLAILDFASFYASENKIIRPANLSGDSIGDMSVLKHSLIQVESKFKLNFDYVLMFQPTSPIRNFEFALEATNFLTRNNHDSLLSVKEVEVKFHPLKQLVISKDKILLYDKRGKAIIARQQLSPTYIRDGVFYGFKRSYVLKSASVVGKNSTYLINKHESINIDSFQDLQRFEEYLKKDLGVSDNKA